MSVPKIKKEPGLSHPGLGAGAGPSALSLHQLCGSSCIQNAISLLVCQPPEGSDGQTKTAMTVSAGQQY